MRRGLALSAIGGVAIATVLYGVVLNGFGWLGPADVDEPASPAQTAASLEGSVASADTAEPEPIRLARDVTPPNVLMRPTSRYVEPVPETDMPEADDEPVIRRFHQVIVRDAGTLEAGGTTIRLAGISAVAADKVCTDDAGRDWPCGRIAAAALRMLIRGRAVDCRIEAQDAGAILAICSTGLQDINGWLVAQGWAEAATGTEYEAEAAEALSDKRGVHMAEWTGGGQGGTGLGMLSAYSSSQAPAGSSPGGEAAVQGTGN